MMALSKQVLEGGPSEIELLLPWHAAGTLNARDARRVDEALARDPELARQYAAIRAEYEETIHLNESLGAPSGRAMQKLFAAIDNEPARRPKASERLWSALSGLSARLSPRTLGWVASFGALALVLQAGIIGLLLSRSGTVYQTASLSNRDGIAFSRAAGPAQGPVARALLRFKPDAHIADISALLEQYQAGIIDGRAGLFRIQFEKPMSQDELSAVLGRMQRDSIVDLAVASP